jgi:ubiquitin C-terminal hydrolase
MVFVLGWWVTLSMFACFWHSYLGGSAQEQIYHLHAVLVHSGDSHGGHYCAFVRPEPGGVWFKFDDDRVTRCSQREAMDDNFGVEPTDPSTCRSSAPAHAHERCLCMHA